MVDNGPEFAGRTLDAWAYCHGVTLRFIRPGKPIENAYVESFNGKFRDECLNEHWFVNLADAKTAIEAWRVDYNTVRPHSSLDGATPDHFARPRRGLAGWRRLASLKTKTRRNPRYPRSGKGGGRSRAPAAETIRALGAGQAHRLAEQRADTDRWVPHPSMADLYRTKVEELAAALRREDSRLEASETLRGLIDSIVLTPEEGQLRIELRGNLAAMLTVAQQTKRSPESGDLSMSVQMVAGACNLLYLAFTAVAA